MRRWQWQADNSQALWLEASSARSHRWLRVNNPDWNVFFFKPYLLLLFRSSPEDDFFFFLKREEDRERHWCEIETLKHQSRTLPDWGLTPQPRVCALAGGQTHNPLAYGVMLQPTEPGQKVFLINVFNKVENWIINVIFLYKHLIFSLLFLKNHLVTLVV